MRSEALMSDSLPQRNGGQILVEALRRNAV
ncbi:hypothetical protein, partial [Pseudomonas aeruginosa]